MKVTESSTVMSQRQSVREVSAITSEFQPQTPSQPASVLESFPTFSLHDLMEFGKIRILAVFSLSDSSTSYRPCGTGYC